MVRKEEKKIAEITRYVTVGLALIQSTAMSIGFGRSGMFEHYTWYNVVVCVITLTAGSAFLMWVGERINRKGCWKWYFSCPVIQHYFQTSR